MQKMPSNRKCNVSFRVQCLAPLNRRDVRYVWNANVGIETTGVYVYDVYKCFDCDCPKRQGFEQFSRVLEMDLVQILSLKWRFPTSIYNILNERFSERLVAAVT